MQDRMLLSSFVKPHLMTIKSQLSFNKMIREMILQATKVLARSEQMLHLLFFYVCTVACLYTVVCLWIVWVS